MRTFQDIFETRKRSFISVFFNLHDCTFNVFFYNSNAPIVMNCLTNVLKKKKCFGNIHINYNSTIIRLFTTLRLLKSIFKMKYSL